MQNRSSGSDEAMRDDAEEDLAKGFPQDRRRRHRTLLLQSALPRASRAQGSSKQPNILFICMDQLRSLADVPEKLPLPSLRRLLREGRVFRNYHVHQAPCGPSRSTFYTGQHIQKTGMYTNPVGEFGTYAPESPRGVELPAGFRRSARCFVRRATTPLTKGSGTSASSTRSSVKMPFRTQRKRSKATASRLQLRRRAQRAHVGGLRP